jgi:N-acetylglucosamine-6-sulfatase
MPGLGQHLLLALLCAPCAVAAANTPKRQSKKPNIVLFLCDDQDLTLGGWTPMKQTTEVWSSKGATAKNWFIHTPVCCPSRAELLVRVNQPSFCPHVPLPFMLARVSRRCSTTCALQSGRYAHNVRMNTTKGGCMHMDTGLVNPNSFGKYLGSQGYTMGWFGKHMNACPHDPPPGWDCPTCYW